MGITSLETTAPARRGWALPPAARTLCPRWLALAAIILVAAALRFANLGALGYANHYYTAGIVSMLQSWRNFFFAAAEPGGAVSIDKPPVGLWLQALSAYFLGINGFAMVLPEILCGLLSIVVVYHLVRRWFGTAAGLLAALALALTPIVVATDRNNTIDSSLILTLLLAAWAFMRATESGRLRWLLLGAGLVGVGFNIKMLQAFLPLPAFYALYFLGAQTKLWRKCANLALATVLLLGVSLSWAVVVDLTPANQRPYVGSSTNNSELNLALGYNGLERLTGMGNSLTSFWQRLTSGTSGRTARGNGAPFGSGNQAPPFGQASPFSQATPSGYANPFGPADGPPFGAGTGNFPAPGQPPSDASRGDGPRQRPGDGFGGPGGFGGNMAGGPAGPGGGGDGGPMNMGQAGVLRLFTTPLSKEVSWLLPFGLFSLGLLLFRARLRWPLARPHLALALWGGWLVTGAVFFSVAGFFHEYYLSMLAAPLAALVGIGVAELWRWREQRPWLAAGLLFGAVAVTVGLQAFTVSAYAGLAPWLAVPLALLGIGAVLVGVSAATRQRFSAVAGTTCLVGAMLFTPGVWSGLTTLNSSNNQSLPAAYSGRASGPSNGGGLQVNPTLLAFLEANTQGMEYLMAVPSAMQGADYVIATGRPVLYLGGFNGQDQVLTAEGLAQLVDQGKLRYIYGQGQGGRNGGQADITAWVTARCTAVPGFETATRNAGAPDGTGAGSGGSANRDITGLGNGGFGGDMQVSLYDCGQ